MYVPTVQLIQSISNLKLSIWSFYKGFAKGGATFFEELFEEGDEEALEFFTSTFS